MPQQTFGKYLLIKTKKIEYIDLDRREHFILLVFINTEDMMEIYCFWGWCVLADCVACVLAEFVF